MNKIYKSIYNAVRGTWVVVSEAISSYKQPSKSVMDSEICCVAPNATAKAIASAVIAACFMLGSGHSFAAPSRSESFYVGGIEISGYSNTFTGYETNLSIYSGSAQSQETNWSFRTSSTAGQHFDHAKYEPYTDIDLSGAHWNSLADGGTGSFTHDTNKIVTLAGSSKKYLFDKLAVNGGTSTISNIGGGTININGSTYTAIYVLGAQPDRDKPAGKATIQNGKMGTINIEGGPVYPAISWGSNSTIENSGNFNILSNGFSYFAERRIGTSTINNHSGGVFQIVGGENTAIETLLPTGYWVWDDSKKAVINNSGNFVISGGTSERAHGIGSAMENSNDGGSGGIVEINNLNLMTIQGGIGIGSHGIKTLVDVYERSGMAEGMGGVAKAVITNNGTLLIQGGTGANSHGIDLMSYGVQKKGMMYSAKSPSLKSLGGDYNSESYITNNEGATLRLLGNVQKGTFGINQMTNGDGTYAYVVIQNSGVMELNKNAINTFGPGTVTIANKSGSTVNTEAGALYLGSYGEPIVGTPQAIPIYVKKVTGETATVQTNAFASNTSSQNGSLTLKDDWKKSAFWELGTTVNFTDIVEGTALAESIRQQFEAAFGTNATLNFTATGGGGGSSEFTKAIVNTLISEGKFADGDVITSETLKLNNESFKLANAGGTFGFNETGFKGILGATDIAVQDGKRLTLMGDMVSIAMAARATDAKPTNRITDSAMTLTNGHLNLGIESMTATGGVLSAITNDAQSSVNVNNGVYVFESLTGDGQLNVGAKGQVYMTGTDNTIANAGHLTIEQAFTLKDKGSTFTKIDAPEFRNEGTVVMQDFTVEEGAEFRNVKNGTTTAKAMKLNAGSSLTNLGTLTVDSLTGWGTIRNKGTLNVSGQLFVPGQTAQVLAGTVNAGDLVIGETSQPQKASLLALNSTGTLMIQGQTFAKNLTFNNGNVQVVEGGTLTQGMDKEAFEKFEKDHKDLVKDKTVLVVDKNFSMGENDSLWVAQDLSDRNLALGDKSLVVLTGNNLKGHAMFESKDGSQLGASIAQGAQFVFDGDVLGRHYVAKGFDEESMEAFKDLTITDLENNKIMDVITNQNGVYIVNGTDDISTIAPNALFKDAFNYLLDGHQGVGNSVLTKYLDKLLTSDGQKITTETTKLAQVGSIVGVQQQGLSRHQMMTESVFGQHYRNTGSVLWATAIGSDGEIEDLSIGNCVQTSFDVKNYGAMVGVDLPITKDLMMGAAVGYMKSDIKPQGFKNEVESVGASLYGEARFNKVRVKGALGYSQGDNEVKGALLDSISADVKTNVASAELIGQMDFSTGSTLLSPYVGVRGLWVKTDDYATKIGSQEAIQNGMEDEIFAQVPIGVELTHVFGTPSGWAVQGHANLGAVYTFGDRTVENIVKADGSTDKIESEVMEELQGRATLGLSVSSKHSRMDLGYSYSQGDMAKSHAVKANMRWVF